MLLVREPYGLSTVELQWKNITCRVATLACNVNATVKRYDHLGLGLA